MRSGGCDACEGQALALRGAGCAFFSVHCEGQALALRIKVKNTVVRGPSRLYQREARIYPTCGVIACRFSGIAYLAPAIAPSSCSS